MTSTSLSVFFAGIKNNYYKNFIILFLIITFLNSCSTDNKAQLDKLKKQNSEIETQIAALEDELKKTDTSSVTDKSTEVSVMPLATQFFLLSLSPLLLFLKNCQAILSSFLDLR